MGLREKFDAAVGAHSLWKKRLADAIASGSSDFDPEIVKTDRNCDFGRWLHGETDPSVGSCPEYRAAIQLHAEFHREAGRILELALTGQKEAAVQAMALDGDYSNISSNLTRLMVTWKSKVKP